MLSIRSAALTSIILAGCIAVAQTPGKTPADSAASIERAASLAETGHCAQALPQLNRARVHISDADLKRRVGLAGVRCGMSVKDAALTVTFISWLDHEFPHDPAVLYLASHVFSDLSVRASNELLATNPASPQVHQLNAEALETMGKWKEAAEEYRVVLSKDPHMAGIHYRLGRLLLSEPNAPPTVKDDARREFEEELNIDPKNAGAEFVLGELSRQAEQLPDAIAHFGKATTLDTTFVDAYIGLGRSLLAAGKAAEAIPPLETATKLQPENPVAHFQLGTAYRRAGRKADADREFTAHGQASEKISQASDEIKKQVSGAGKPVQ